MKYVINTGLFVCNSMGSIPIGIITRCEQHVQTKDLAGALFWVSELENIGFCSRILVFRYSFSFHWDVRV